ncbi:sulfur carrier protein ThiS [Oxalobacteraceae bacterium A2-2]
MNAATQTNTIAVTVNGTPHQVDAATLADLLALLDHAPDSVATAVNGEYVARGLRGAHILQAGDQITCFQAIVGG